MNARKVRHSSLGRTAHRREPQATAAVRAASAPLADDAPTAFVIMPYSAVSDLTFETVIRPATTAAGYRVVRADTTLNQRAIMQDVVTGIQNADVVLADLTGRNANVFYELGLAHALKRPTILLAQDAAEIPFDLKAYRAVIYSIEFGTATELVSSLGMQMEPLLSAAIQNAISFGSPFLDYGEPQTAAPDEPTEGVLDILDRLLRIDVPDAISAMARTGLAMQSVTADMEAVTAEMPTEPDLPKTLLVAEKLANVFTAYADELEPIVDGELIPSVLRVEKGAEAYIRGTLLVPETADIPGLFAALDSMSRPADEFASMVRSMSGVLRTQSQWTSSLLGPGRRLAAIFDRIAANIDRLAALSERAETDFGIHRLSN